jgi:agmatine deiminase
MRQARQMVGNLPNVTLHDIPTNDAWTRDHGPMFLIPPPDQPPALVDWQYNAWGGKYPPFDRDRRVAAYMAEALGVARFAPGLVLEGGSIDVNGAGALLTTEQCLLNPNRNPELTREDIEAALRSAFGIDEIVWLGDGIEGDDTDGHIDDLTRFVAVDTVVTAVEPNRDDPNHAPLAANRAALDRVEVGGRPLEVVELPMPAPQFNAGQRLPASYANFYLANELVLLPVFECDSDVRAVEILAECFPERRVIAVDSRGLVGGLGALHCLTQQVPRAGV